MLVPGVWLEEQNPQTDLDHGRGERNVVKKQVRQVGDSGASGKGEDSEARGSRAGKTAWFLSLDVVLSGGRAGGFHNEGEDRLWFFKFLLSQDCVEDAVSPIILRLNFSLVRDSASPRNLRPVLAVGSQDHITASVSSFQWSPRDRMATLYLHML